jgi:hypothetical protein
MLALFIHGVTVRRDRFEVLLETVREQLTAMRHGMSVDGIYWGDHASSLAFGGASIPGFIEAGSRGVSGDVDTVELISVLVEDPLFELERLAEDGRGRSRAAPSLIARASAKAEARNAVLNAARPQVIKRITQAQTAFLPPSDALSTPAVKKLVARTFDVAMDTDDSLSVEQLIGPLTRALTIQLATHALDELTLDSPFEWIPAEHAVQAILEEQFQGERGVLSRGAASFATLALRKGLRRRLMRAQSLFMGDVLTYLSHRDAIQAHVEAEVDRACEACGEDELWLVGHSLGGIIAFEYCQAGHRDVAKLATVGSQVGLLAELGVLRLDGVGVSKKHAPPQRTAVWRNVYDPDDMLSFLAAPIFSGVQDIAVDTGAPFPLSHSEYWNCQAAYAAVSGN